MKQPFTLLLLFSCFPILSIAQFYEEDFDPGELSPWVDTLNIQLDSGSVWQIGIPQKLIFNEAYSLPNAILTDTMNAYPSGDTAVFEVVQFMDEDFFNEYYGIAAFKWVQKLDIDSLDGGTVDFSVDNGQTWENAFSSPYIYNWYGWENENLDTLENGTIVFSGVDSLWREVWLCYEYGWLSTVSDTLRVRFTFFSDSIQGNSDGWMIDNLRLEPTFVHTVEEQGKSESYVNIYPNPASDIVHIQLKKSPEYHIIEELKIFSMEGRIVKSFSQVPTKFFVDVSDLPPGVYEMLIRSNLKTEVHKLILND